MSLKDENWQFHGHKLRIEESFFASVLFLNRETL